MAGTHAIIRVLLIPKRQKSSLPSQMKISYWVSVGFSTAGPNRAGILFPTGVGPAAKMLVTMQDHRGLPIVTALTLKAATRTVTEHSSTHNLCNSYTRIHSYHGLAYTYMLFVKDVPDVSVRDG